MMGSMFCLFVVEMYINNKLGGHAHSHGGPMGFESQPPAPVQLPGSTRAAPPPQRPPRYSSATDFEIEDVEYEKKVAQEMYNEKLKGFQQQRQRSAEDKELGGEHEVVPSEMPPWFIVFYEQYVRQRLELINMIRASRPQDHQSHQQQLQQTGGGDKRQSTVSISASPYIDEETGQPVDPAVYRKMSLNITLLEGGILFHSVFVGMTVSITIDGFIILLIAILFHQMFEGLGLGSRIAAVPYPRRSIRPWLLVVAFGTTAPLGQAIGLAARNSYDPNSAFGLIIVGVFNAM